MFIPDKLQQLKEMRSKEEGFTIIEVVLVLAIVGLIFLVVFLAVPQLQRSRRNTARRNDAGRLAAGVEEYSGNNNGDVPTRAQVGTDVIGDYLGSDFEDPSAGAYAVQAGAPNDAGEVQYVTNAECNGSGGIATGSGTRTFAIVFPIETSNGYTETYCVDNS